VLRAHGSKPKYFHGLIGGNFRLDTVQAALLRVKLPHLDAYTEGRRRNAARYDALFAAAGLSPERLRRPAIGEGHVFNQYVIRTDRRDALMEHLKSRQIDTAIYYPLALHRQACFAGLGLGEGSLPVAEQACREVLALPVYPELGEARLARVVEACLEVLAA
jgi:dTDP-4-amino-4,6-dideoxygalactose transaminase